MIMIELDGIDLEAEVSIMRKILEADEVYVDDNCIKHRRNATEHFHFSKTSEVAKLKVEKELKHGTRGNLLWLTTQSFEEYADFHGLKRTGVWLDLKINELCMTTPLMILEEYPLIRNMAKKGDEIYRAEILEIPNKLGLIERIKRFFDNTTNLRVVIKTYDGGFHNWCHARDLTYKNDMSRYLEIVNTNNFDMFPNVKKTAIISKRFGL